MRLSRPALPVLMLAGLAAAPLAAQERVVIYRCTGVDGAVIVQNDRPCPSGTVQRDRRVIRAPDPAPAARPGVIEAAPGTGTVSAPGAPGVIPPTPSPGIAPVPGAPGVIPPAPGPGIAPAPGAGIVPAPATTAVPPAALATVPGVSTEGGAPPPLYSCRTPGGPVYFSENPSPPPRCATLTTSGLGPAPAAGSACEVVRDDCTPVPAENLCASWRARLAALDSAMTFGRLDQRGTASVELDRVRGIVEDSTCGG